MELSELMLTKPEDLATKQRDALTYHAVEVLNKITTALSKGDYKAIENLTFHSAAGDGNGNENDCINFSYKAGSYLDIQELVDQLKQLTSTIKASKN